jgi:phosphotriesterase-related protein
MSVMTVQGKINVNDLGVVTPHEHIFIDMSVFFVEPVEASLKAMAHEPVTIEKLGVLKRNPFALLDNVQMLDKKTQIDELMQFKYAGGRTVVDATTIGLARDPELLREVAVRTGLNIIVGAGFYVAGAQRPETLEFSAEQMEEQIVHEIDIEIGHSGIRAGIIGEIGVSHIMYPFEKKSLTAACRAQVRTGAPLMIHINPWSTQGLEAMSIVHGYGVAPGKVVICHSDVENRADYIFTLLDKGIYIEFDNFGKEMATDFWDVKPGSGRFVTDWERVRLLKQIIDKGYGSQILFSCDVCLKTLLHAYGGWGYDHVITHILPMLKETGVTQHQIDDIMIYNPAKWLS